MVAFSGVTGTCEICVTLAGAFGIFGTLGKVVGAADGAAAGAARDGQSCEKWLD